MNENETRIAEKLATQIPQLSPERREKLGQIMEVAAMVLTAHEQVLKDKAANADEKAGA